jgi:hypothetical protein
MTAPIWRVSDPASFVLPGWDIGWNGFEFGLPVVSGGAADNPGVRVADVQVWLGTYIDPSNADNLAKFISGGRPVNPAVAETAFGAPTYRLAGPASGITNNTGTGGDFTKTGTVTDATPGP